MRSLSLFFVAILAQHCALAQAASAKPEVWQLKVVRDTFTDKTDCQLRTRDGLIRFQPGAIGFLFPHRRDTLAAWYRIGDGAPVRWQDRYATLVAAGVHVVGPGLDDPTSGIVWIPQTELASARSVSIRLGAKDRPRSFMLEPITSSIADAETRGCRFTGGGQR